MGRTDQPRLRGRGDPGTRGSGLHQPHRPRRTPTTDALPGIDVDKAARHLVTDYALIPLKQRVIDGRYDPGDQLFRDNK
jgi:hypothetical protein